MIAPIVCSSSSCNGLPLQDQRHVRLSHLQPHFQSVENPASQNFIDHLPPFIPFHGAPGRTHDCGRRELKHFLEVGMEDRFAEQSIGYTAVAYNLTMEITHDDGLPRLLQNHSGKPFFHQGPVVLLLFRQVSQNRTMQILVINLKGNKTDKNGKIRMIVGHQSNSPSFPRPGENGKKTES